MEHLGAAPSAASGTMETGCQGWGQRSGEETAPLWPGQGQGGDHRARLSCGAVSVTPGAHPARPPARGWARGAGSRQVL